jgi:hypothetical protein
MISYEDFDLRIQAARDGFEVVARSGDKTAREPFSLDIAEHLDFWNREARGPVEVREPGAALFKALIRGSVRDLYQQGKGWVGGDAAKGLRIRIHIDSREEALRPLLELPWEILFDSSADAGGLLGLNPRFPIVRVLDSNVETVSPSTAPLRRVLLAQSNPRHLVRLDLESECKKIKDALQQVQIRPESLKQTTCSTLRESISNGEYQVIHFMGHGSFDSEMGEGVLHLEAEDERRIQDLLPASRFASFFAGRAAPRLVILTACLSAAPGSLSAVGPFASVAAALVAAGLPAVVAMQANVRNRSAVRFTECLYQRIAGRDSIEEAVSRARLALQASQAGGIDWAIPVLFMRGQAVGTVWTEENFESQEPRPAGTPTMIVQKVISTIGKGGVGINAGYIENIYQNQEHNKK